MFIDKMNKHFVSTAHNYEILHFVCTVGWVFGLCPLSMKIKVLETGSVSGLK
jgi:hypothetical protein